MQEAIVLIISGKTVQSNAKIDWPDLNFPGSGQTILRTLHKVDCENLKIQLDGSDGPWFDNKTFPEGVGFYKKICATKK